MRCGLQSALGFPVSLQDTIRLATVISRLKSGALILCPFNPVSRLLFVCKAQHIAQVL